MPLLVAGIVIACAMALPLAYLLLVVLGSGSAALETVFSSRTAGLLLRSVGLAAAVTASAIAIAVPLAWLTARTDLPGARAWAVLAALPLVVPSYVGAYAFLSALGPTGLLQDILAGPFGVERLPSIVGFPGAWLVLTLFTYPLIFLPVRAAILGLDPQLEEAARASGRDARSAFTSVVMPQLLPAIAAGGVLVALYTLHDFGAVSIMRFDTFTRDIFLEYRSSLDRIGAASLSLVLVAVMLILLWIEGRVRGNRALHRVGPGAARRARRESLGRWRPLAIGFCAAVTSLGVILPAAVLVYWATRSFAGQPEWGEIATAAGHSLLVSGLAAVVAAGCAIPVAILAVRHRNSGTKALDWLAHIGYALPGVVVALALVYFGTRVATPLYQTVAMLVFAFVVLFLPLATSAAKSRLGQMSPRLEEAARITGRGPLAVLRSITAPLMAGGLLAGSALVFLTAVKELPATLILAPTGFQTLATETWTATSVGFFERGAIPALLLLLISAPSLYLLFGHERSAA